MHGSKVKLEPELDDSRVAGYGSDPSKVSVRLFQCRVERRRNIRVAGIQVVKRIDEVCAESHPQILTPAEVLDQRYIPVVDSRTDDDSSASRAEVGSCGRERRRVEPLCDRLRPLRI